MQALFLTPECMLATPFTASHLQVRLALHLLPHVGEVLGRQHPGVPRHPELVDRHASDWPLEDACLAVVYDAHQDAGVLLVQLQLSQLRA